MGVPIGMAQAFTQLTTVWLSTWFIDSLTRTCWLKCMIEWLTSLKEYMSEGWRFEIKLLWARSSLKQVFSEPTLLCATPSLSQPFFELPLLLAISSARYLLFYALLLPWAHLFCELPLSWPCSCLRSFFPEPALTTLCPKGKNMSQTNLLRKQSGAFPKRMSVASHLKLLHGRSISCAFCKCQLQTHEAQTQREIVGVVQRSSSNAYRNTFHNPRRRDVPANQRLFASQIACTQLRR